MEQNKTPNKQIRQQNPNNQLKPQNQTNTTTPLHCPPKKKVCSCKINRYGQEAGDSLSV